MKKAPLYIGLQLELEACDFAPDDITYFKFRNSKRKRPDVAVCKGQIFSLTHIGVIDDAVTQKKEVSLKKSKQIALSAYDREVLGGNIDERFIRMKKETPDMSGKEIFQLLSENSSEWLGYELGPRQIEGRHYTYINNLRKHIRKNSAICKSHVERLALPHGSE